MDRPQSLHCRFASAEMTKARVAIAPCEGFRDGQTAGPSTALRSGRDDNSVAGIKYLPLHPLVAVQEGGVLRVDDA
jgi:hypothetical protein